MEINDQYSRVYFSLHVFVVIVLLFVLCLPCCRVCYCYLVVTWRKRAVFFALVCDVYFDFVTFPFGILGQVWYLIVSIPDPCCRSYFVLV